MAHGHRLFCNKIFHRPKKHSRWNLAGPAHRASCFEIAFFNTERAEPDAEAAEQIVLRPAVAADWRRSACLQFQPGRLTEQLVEQKRRSQSLLFRQKVRQGPALFSTS